MRVLVVDDDPLIRISVAEGLRQRGDEVVVADNGIQALSLWSAGEFDAVVADVRMPEMSGIELAREIRASESSRPGVVLDRLVALTGSASAVWDIDVYEQFDSVLMKPASADSIYDAVRGLWRTPV